MKERICKVGGMLARLSKETGKAIAEAKFDYPESIKEVQTLVKEGKIKEKGTGIEFDFSEKDSVNYSWRGFTLDSQKAPALTEEQKAEAKVQRAADKKEQDRKDAIIAKIELEANAVGLDLDSYVSKLIASK